MNYIYATNCEKDYARNSGIYKKFNNECINSFGCEDCYACVKCVACNNSKNCSKCFACDYCDNCKGCNECIQCKNCIDCLCCFGLNGEREQQYRIFSIQYNNREEWEKAVKNL